MFTVSKPFRAAGHLPLLCICVWAGSVVATAQAGEQATFLVLQLKDDLAQVQQHATLDAQVRQQLENLARQVPELSTSLARRTKNAPALNALEERYGIGREFTIDLGEQTSEQREGLLRSLQDNPLVASVGQGEVAQPSDDQGQAQPRQQGRNAASQAEPSYRQGPLPAAGYKLGGINSEAVSDMPGGKGQRARVVIASDNYWNVNHESLPSLAFSPIPGPQRLSCGVDYRVGNYATAAAGIIGARDKGAGMVGIVPEVQLAAAPASSASIYDEVYDLGLQPGDVLVVDQAFSNTTSKMGLFRPYPGDTCPKASPTMKSALTCQLPSVGYESTQRRIEILTQAMGVHVVVNASGGVPYSTSPATPLNLDHRDFNGLFDRSRNDDGSIFVSSVDPRTGNSLAANYGSRIDLSTWATHITYPSYKAGEGHNSYSRYDRDDALNYRLSAYIMAGAVAQIQSIAFAEGLGPVPPRIMRSLLVETGHAFVDQDAGRPIGKQPDVKAAVDRMLRDYRNGFPPEPAPEFGIKRVTGDTEPFHGVTWRYHPIMSLAGDGPVTYQWDGLQQPPFENVMINPATGDLQFGIEWTDGLNHRQYPVTLTARDNQGHVDSWSLDLSVAPLVWGSNGDWDLPDKLTAGQTVNLSGRLTGAIAPGQQVFYYLKAPALFEGVKTTSASAPTPGTFNFTVPANLAPGTPVRVQLLATEAELRQPGLVAASQRGRLLTKTVTIGEGEASPPLMGSLSVPASVTGNTHYQFTVNIDSAGAGDTLSYQWQLPDGFTPPGNKASASGFVPGTADERAVQVGVKVSGAAGQTLDLSRPLLIKANLPRAEIEGPASITMVAGESRTFVVRASLPDGSTPTYNWGRPAGFEGASSTSERITLVAPKTDQPIDSYLSVIVSGKNVSQVVVSKPIHVQPASAAADETCATPWSRTTAYASAGQRVSYAGYNYEVAHWTQANQPDQNFVLSGSAKPWRRIGACSP